MSRLTKYQKQDFINRVMQDVPTVDYDTQVQQLIQQDAYNQMPQEIKAIYDNPKLRHFLFLEYVNLGRHSLPGVQVYAERGYASHISPETIVKIGELSALKDRQRTSHLKIKSELSVIVHSCTTSAKLVKALPEFKQYLPIESQPPITTLPSTTHLITQLIQAGWKQKESN